MLDSRLKKYIKERQKCKRKGIEPKYSLDHKYRITDQDRELMRKIKRKQKPVYQGDYMNNSVVSVDKANDIFENSDVAKIQKKRDKDSRKARSSINDMSKMDEDKYYDIESNLFNLSSKDIPDYYPNPKRIGKNGLNEIRDLPMDVDDHFKGFGKIGKKIKKNKNKKYPGDDNFFLPNIDKFDELKHHAYKSKNNKNIYMPPNFNPKLKMRDPDIESDMRFGFTTRGGKEAGYKNPFEHQFSFISSDQITNNFLEPGFPSRSLKYEKAIKKA